MNWHISLQYKFLITAVSNSGHNPKKEGALHRPCCLSEGPFQTDSEFQLQNKSQNMTPGQGHLQIQLCVLLHITAYILCTSAYYCVYSAYFTSKPDWQMRMSIHWRMSARTSVYHNSHTQLRVSNTYQKPIKISTRELRS